MLFSTKVPCSVASVALFCKFSQFYTNLKNLQFAMNEKNGIEESKPKQSQRQGESAPDLPVGRAYAVEPLANRVGKVLSILENWACCRCKQRTFICKT